ncbi:hypothetical protein; 3-mannosyl-glycoprotein 2-beta-N-acetylglucosaminyltransferase [Paratrimastix pyriformis]|uniref:alpha-1,3-mannosyl-glycoprotein 2-beta-N-acetylglucosaminyltransferase n=1 Tax=Paratrimastix pyriformis TaxID=342808 RepID=A0ABQ8UE42_9EUKA|nr:hypothetical protein; 3-mannosyl-glycoprotein 2-beta-N-acetylglucosaminyltransferase [Paratrimastix pyriformis]
MPVTARNRSPYRGKLVFTVFFILICCAGVWLLFLGQMMGTDTSSKADPSILKPLPVPRLEKESQPGILDPSMEEPFPVQIPKTPRITQPPEELEEEAPPHPPEEPTLTHPEVKPPPQPQHQGVPKADLSNAAIVVLAFNRPQYLTQTLDSLFKVAHIDKYPVYVSEDGYDTSVAKVARDHPIKELIQHPRKPRFSGQTGSAFLAQHYKWALDKLFFDFGHSHVIIFEDDMIFSPDILQYFEQLGGLLDADPTLWCVSTWNDNGFPELSSDPRRLMRVGYFPGLGWMLKKSLWSELSPNFPLDHWDHWMRLPHISHGRECVVPEVSRNYNIGLNGANMNPSDYERLFRGIAYNQQADIDLGDPSRMVKKNYDAWLTGLMHQSHIVPARAVVSLARGDKSTPAGAAMFPGGTATWPSLDQLGVGDGERVVTATYLREEYPGLADQLHIWPVPRGHHDHVLVLHWHDHRLWVILADARHSPFLPESLRVGPSPGFKMIAGRRGENCDVACSRNGMRCEASHFDWVNNCTALSQFFPCENGYGLVVGPDIPNYVSLDSDKQARKCLITEQNPQCGAAHLATERLCPCLPRTM